MPGHRPCDRASAVMHLVVCASRGAGSVLVLAIVGATLALTAALVPVLGLLVSSQLAANAADAAALAAADALTGAVPGRPCALARTAAARNGARLVSCEGDERAATATVAVVVRSLTFELTARARAGPPPTRRSPARRGQSKTVSMKRYSTALGFDEPALSNSRPPPRE